MGVGAYTRNCSGLLFSQAFVKSDHSLMTARRHFPGLCWRTAMRRMRGILVDLDWACIHLGVYVLCVKWCLQPDGRALESEEYVEQLQLWDGIKDLRLFNNMFKSVSVWHLTGVAACWSYSRCAWLVVTVEGHFKVVVLCCGFHMAWVTHACLWWEGCGSENESVSGVISCCHHGLSLRIWL